MATQAFKLGAVLDYAFQRNADGSPSVELSIRMWIEKDSAPWFKRDAHPRAGWSHVCCFPNSV